MIFDCNFDFDFVTLILHVWVELTQHRGDWRVNVQFWLRQKLQCTLHIIIKDMDPWIHGSAAGAAARAAAGAAAGAAASAATVCTYHVDIGRREAPPL